MILVYSGSKRREFLKHIGDAFLGMQQEKGALVKSWKSGRSNYFEWKSPTISPRCLKFEELTGEIFICVVPTTTFGFCLKRIGFFNSMVQSVQVIMLNWRTFPQWRKSLDVFTIKLIATRHDGGRYEVGGLPMTQDVRLKEGEVL